MAKTISTRSSEAMPTSSINVSRFKPASTSPSKRQLVAIAKVITSWSLPTRTSGLGWLSYTERRFMKPGRLNEKKTPSRETRSIWRRISISQNICMKSLYILSRV